MNKMVLKAPEMYELLKEVDGKLQVSYTSIEDIDKFVTLCKPHVKGYRKKGATTDFKEIVKNG